ncbi:DUF2274 domain-containing protein [Sphingopyxis sp.]|uniref:DUF2274 domain-containing protein n=1 Tax=Sphingopyxis sp. TaxID=1908224 RepID=UPI003D6D4AA8
MTKLRLGPVADEKPVKLTIELSGRLFRELSEYSAAHARETGLAEPLSPERIAPRSSSASLPVTVRSINSAIASSGCSVTSRSTAPLPPDTINSPTASSMVHIATARCWLKFVHAA